MRLATVLIVATAFVSLPALSGTAQTLPSSYAGQQARSIKALYGEDITALRNGDGMGMAKAAELNGYPGPRHVLTLARQLHLTDAQISQVAEIRDRMGAAAQPLGVELIERERALDQLFTSAEITPDRLSSATAAIGDLHGRLRAVHLAAHLETRAVLSTGQVLEYDKLRGYAKATTSGGHGPRNEHNHH